MKYIKKFLKKIGLLDILLRIYFRYLFFKDKKLKRWWIMRTYNPDLFYLNIGSGSFVRKNWRVLDYSGVVRNNFPSLLIDYDIDLIKSPRLPISDNSAELVFCSHVLEHIGDKPAQNVFNEAYRILKQGGVFRVVLPDADKIYDAYKRNDITWFRSVKKGWDESWPVETHYFKWVSTPYMTTSEGVREDVQMLSKEEFFEKYRKEITNFTNHDFQQHITWFNFNKVKKMAEKAGFTDIRRSAPRQSIVKEMRDPMFDTNERVSLCVDVIR